MQQPPYPTGATPTDDAGANGARTRYAQDRVMAWYAVMVNAYQHLSAEDRAAVDEWDDQRPSHLSTSDWPGWARHIDMDTFWPWDWPPGFPPWMPERSTDDPPAVGFHLYRLWCPDGRLLYVGVSTRLRARLRAHQRRWPDLWDHATWEAHPDAAAMLAAEREAISAECPAMNSATIT